nr:isochorismatase family protein [Pseudonocardia acidicola]
MVDVRRTMLEGDFPVPEAPAVRAALTTLLAGARQAGLPVVHVQNAGDPDAPGTPGWDLVLPPADGDMVVPQDRVGHVRVEPGTGRRAAHPRRHHLAVAGMQSDYCVAGSCRAACPTGSR